MILWKQISPLNLIMWHFFKFSIKDFANFKMFAQKTTCSNILVQNLSCFQKFDSKCQAARKLDRENVLYFTKNFQNQDLREKTKVPPSLLSQCKFTQRNCFFLRANFPKIVDFRHNFSLQNLMLCDYFDSSSDGCWKGWFEIWHALENLILNLMKC